MLLGICKSLHCMPRHDMQGSVVQRNMLVPLVCATVRSASLRMKQVALASFLLVLGKLL